MSDASYFHDSIGPYRGAPSAGIGPGMLNVRNPALLGAH